MDFPSYRLPPPPILTPFHPDCRGFVAAVALSGAASSAYLTANKGFFYAFTLTDAATAYQLLWYVGATSSGNIDVGIYDSQYNRIVSAGSTAMSATTNTVQELNITDTTLNAGNYFLAGACDNTTGTVFSNNPADEQVLALSPIYEQAGLTGPTLPNPATPVISTEATPPTMAIGIQLRSVF